MVIDDVVGFLTSLAKVAGRGECALENILHLIIMYGRRKVGGIIRMLHGYVRPEQMCY